MGASDKFLADARRAAVRDYWRNFYTSHALPRCPSQFAAFVLNEYQDARFVIDVGCGSGRDLLFFLANNLVSIGVDESAPLEKITELSQSLHGRAPTILQERVSTDLPEKILSILQAEGVSDSYGLIYARFFLHAIDLRDELLFWELCKKIADKRNISIALEFRTPKDMDKSKATPSHFRRFEAAASVVQRAAKFGFELAYSVEGVGFAKYKQDDAHVARLLFSSRNISDGLSPNV